MNALYAKTILSIYPSIDSLTEVIDRNVMKKALASFKDYSPVNEQAEKILACTKEKNLLIDLKLAVNAVFKGFMPEERALLLRRFNECFKGLAIPQGISKRTYYRRINKLIAKLCGRLERAGFTDEYFEQNYLNIPFIKKVFLKTKKYENSFRVNRVSEGALSATGDKVVKGRAILENQAQIKQNVISCACRAGEQKR